MKLIGIIREINVGNFPTENTWFPMEAYYYLLI